jgi:phosphoribosylamine--glycine ligase
MRRAPWLAVSDPKNPDVTALLLGSGGREHALAWKLAQSPRLKNLFAAPGSDAMAAWAQNLPIDPADPRAVVQAARDCHAKLVFIGPEAPLAAGVADALREAGIAVFGPGQAVARLESSKVFAKEFMDRHQIPTARWEAFTDSRPARGVVEAMSPPLVVKADGLAAGKGVVVCRSANEALGAVADFMERGTMGAAGRKIVVESCLQGPELSVLAFCDGSQLRLLPFSRDHKRLQDDDQGPNTGGMGAYAPVELDAGTYEAVQRVLDRVLAGLQAEAMDYRGLLYVGLMLTAEGPKVLEFNCRFGDPETQALLPLLESDLLELALACAEGKLGSAPLRFKSGVCLTVTLASGGYPVSPAAGKPIAGLDAPSPEGVLIFHSGTRKAGGQWVTAGGRVLSVTALGHDVAEARSRAYAAVKNIHFDGMQYRKDIALTGVLR